TRYVFLIHKDMSELVLGQRANYVNLYNTSETFKNTLNDELDKWLIISKSLMNEDGSTDYLKKFSNQSQKFITITYIYEDYIIDHLKKEESKE
ncbi:18588_t:CDS:2, partial [Racocetra fulgida]